MPRFDETLILCSEMPSIQVGIIPVSRFTKTSAQLRALIDKSILRKRRLCKKIVERLSRIDR